jgi:hypothetical protein
LQDIRQNIVLPLLNQIESDSDDNTGRLVAGRLGVESPPESVIEQAERLSVTRARIYQLLELSSHIMRVRWPEGSWQLLMLSELHGQQRENPESREMLATLRSLLYPTKQRSESLRLEALEAASS